MKVNVDHARKHHEASGVEDFTRLGAATGRQDASNLAVADGDVRGRAVGSRQDGVTIADQEIVHTDQARNRIPALSLVEMPRSCLIASPELITSAYFSLMSNRLTACDTALRS